MSKISQPLPGAWSSFILAQGDEAGRTLSLKGRAAWMLNQLIDAGPQGLVTAQFPGVRISAHVLDLRMKGLLISTEYEPNGGEFKGRHGRFTLMSKVTRCAREARP
ncbi:hypothetical protein [Albirhodobacter sp. R86504]|uniref:winged helix domain-containing protein n=1 Tax=Albirhodobacter sp. R86504 TaxID=3093848 RepID=UPI00366B5AA9